MQSIIIEIFKEFGLSSFVGLSHILSNPFAIMLIIVCIYCIGKGALRGCRKLYRYAALAFAMGYGSILIDGAKLLINHVK